MLTENLFIECSGGNVFLTRVEIPSTGLHCKLVFRSRAHLMCVLCAQRCAPAAYDALPPDVLFATFED